MSVEAHHSWKKAINIGVRGAVITTLVGTALALENTDKAKSSGSYQVFLPLVSTGPYVQEKGKGLAMDDPSHPEDLAVLGVIKYYMWGESCQSYTAEGCLNMVRNWNIGPGVPASCYPDLLLGNEPTNQEPGGFPISPIDAVTATIALESKCPNMRIIAGNVHIGNWRPAGSLNPDIQWVVDYLTIYKNQTGHTFGSEGQNIFGLHCYSFPGDPADFCQKQISFLEESVRNLYGPSGNRHPFWITEFNVIDPQGQRIAEFQGLLDFFKDPANRVSMVFPFTNRGEPDGFPYYFNLIDSNGNPVNNGVPYAAWQYP